MATSAAAAAAAAAATACEIIMVTVVNGMNMINDGRQIIINSII